MARRTVEFESLPEALRSPTFGAQIAARLDMDARMILADPLDEDRPADQIAVAQADAYRLTAEEIRKWHVGVRP